MRKNLTDISDTFYALEAEGLLLTETEYIGKRLRIYYSLSKEGKSQSKEKVKEFNEFVATMNHLLDTKTKHALQS